MQDILHGKARKVGLPRFAFSRSDSNFVTFAVVHPPRAYHIPFGWEVYNAENFQGNTNGIWGFYELI